MAETNPTTDAADEAFAGSSPETAQLRLELAEARDRELRALAEIENTRRRMRRDFDDQSKYALQPLIRDLLPVVDNVARAIEAGQSATDVATLLEGFKLVATQLETVLSKHGGRRIDAIGQAFDPNLHEAILQQPSQDHPPGTVLLEALPGYTLHDRVVRPTQVIVSASG